MKNFPGIAIAAGVSLVVTSALVVNHSSAAFSGTTSNDANSINSANVSITDNDNGAALITIANAVPGDLATQCITTEYTGSVAASVAFYTSVTNTALAPYLTTTVEVGPEAASCATFTPAETVFSGKLSALATHNSYDTGYGAATWHPKETGAGAGVVTDLKRTWRIKVSLDDNNAAQGKSANFGLIWEARNR